MASAATSLVDLENDPRLFLYTSLTAGSSHIITATSRMETILKAHKIPFQAIDMATDEKARRLWQRRAQGRKLPGLVKDGFVIADLNEVEDWNEFGELKENIGPVPPSHIVPPGGQVGVNIAPPLSVNPTATHGTTDIIAPPVPIIGGSSLHTLQQPITTTSGFDSSKGIALPGAAEIAARNKPAPATTETLSSFDTLKAETMTSSPAQKQESIQTAKEVAKDHPSIEHLSAPGSAIHSGTVTPQQAQEGEDLAAAGQPAATETHRGSEAKAAPSTVIQDVEKKIALPEEDEEDDEGKDDDKDGETEGAEIGKVEEARGVAKADKNEASQEEPKEASKGVSDLPAVESLTLDATKEGEDPAALTQEQSAAEPAAATKSVED